MDWTQRSSTTCDQLTTLLLLVLLFHRYLRKCEGSAAAYQKISILAKAYSSFKILSNISFNRKRCIIDLKLFNGKQVAYVEWHTWNDLLVVVV